MKEELLCGRYDTRGTENADMEIFHHLLESEDLFGQWWSASNDQEEKIL